MSVPRGFISFQLPPFYEGLGPQDPYLWCSVRDPHLLLLLRLLLHLLATHTQTKDTRGINSLSIFTTNSLSERTCRTGVLKD